jgi:NADH dehydrogenase FAD-containing subunit
VVDKYSRTRGFDNPFAIGDISAFEIVDPKGSMISSNIAPQLAQFAVRQALFVAENIARREKGEEMIGELTFSQRGHTIPLDDKILGLLSRLLVTGKMCE